MTDRPPHTLADVLAALPAPAGEPLPAPPYAPGPNSHRWHAALAVESMKRHTSDEGWQLTAGLESVGYCLHGHGLPVCKSPEGITDVRRLARNHLLGTVVVQDKREWLGLTAGRQGDVSHAFTNVEALRKRPDVFRVGVVKDAHADLALHRQSAEEAGFHAWIIYYAPAVVCRLLPFLRPEHLVRTWHSVDREAVPPFRRAGRSGCLLSGALGRAYPLRTRLAQSLRDLPETVHMRHPGYRADGCRTPEYLKILSTHEVAICTASRYGYALRKLVEATACGCRVVTDLPADEVLPHIDGNLTRVRPDSTVKEVAAVVEELMATYNPDAQEYLAEKAQIWYDFRAVGARLAEDVEALRRTYPNREPRGPNP